MTEAAAWRVAWRTVLLVFGIIAAVWLLVQLRSVVVQVVLAVILAAGMAPPVDRLTRPVPLWPDRVGWRGRRSSPAGDGAVRTWAPPRALVVLLLYLVVIGVAVALGALLLPPAAQDLEDLVRRLPAYAAAVQDWVVALPARYPFLAQLDLSAGAMRQLASGVAQLGSVFGQAVVVLRVAMGVLGGALNGIFVLVLALYITEDMDRIRRYALSFLPPERRDRTGLLLSRIGQRLGGWLRGQLTLSAIIGGMSLVGLWTIGVPYAVLLALVAAVGEAVPLIGPIISAVPAVLVAFFQSPVQGLLTIGLYVLVQQLENNLVVPKVMQQAVALHPLAVMVALLAGGELLGVTGAILSVPVAATVAVVLEEVRYARLAVPEGAVTPAG